VAVGNALAVAIVLFEAVTVVIKGTADELCIQGYLQIINLPGDGFR